MGRDPSPLLRVFFLDVGQGDCTFIVPPDGEGAPILFDCADAYVAERFVANHGITDVADQPTPEANGSGASLARYAATASVNDPGHPAAR